MGITMLPPETYQYKTRTYGPGLRPGFTLLEIIITVLILSIGCMAALVMQSSALKGNNLSDNMTVATFLAESEIERLNSMTYEAVVKEVNDGAPGHKTVKYLNRKAEACPNSSLADCKAFPFIMEIGYYPRQPTTRSQHIEVAVDWQDNVGKHAVLYSAIFSEINF
jgi:prepilin-type N-terminal cleavage/methylation domain-containing protein